MEFIIIIWLIFALAVPPALLIIGIINFAKKAGIAEILFKLSIAFFLYFLITFIILIFAFSNIFALINRAADAVPPLSNPFETEHIVIASLIILGYACFGLVLCWFVKRDLMKSLSFITGNNKKLQSIFDAE